MKIKSGPTAKPASRSSRARIPLTTPSRAPQQQGKRRQPTAIAHVNHPFEWVADHEPTRLS